MSEIINLIPFFVTDESDFGKPRKAGSKVGVDGHKVIGNETGTGPYTWQITAPLK